MGLTSDLISEFVKITKDKPEQSKESTSYGTTVEYDGRTFVRLDGSELLTPVETTTNMSPGERVTVLIKNHQAIVTGNISSPSATTGEVEDLGNQISEFEIVVAEKVSTKELEAEKGRIDNLITENLAVKETLTAQEAIIDDLEVNNVKINEKLEVHEADIGKLTTDKLDASIADITFATIENLEATDLKVNNLNATYGEFESLTTKNFEAIDADIEELKSKSIDVEELNAKYANIDFSNIGEAAIEHFYATSGLIKDVVVGDGVVTGELVGVTIKGDLIEGGTVVADKLVIKGEDGLYYKLNSTVEGITSEQLSTEEYQSGLHGSNIIANTITAEKINVKDLVAFDATIGGFNITDDSLYSGVKESINNTTRGIYMDNTGQIAFGDGNNYIKYYKDTTTNTWKLDISAETITIGTSGDTVETIIDDIKHDVEILRDEITTLLRIESSRGTVFKNDTVSTVLSVVIYHGTQRITDSATMKSVFGSGAYLQWYWQRLDDDSYGVLSSSDTRFGDDGFTFTLSPEDVDTKVTFMCELIT